MEALSRSKGWQPSEGEGGRGEGEGVELGLEGERGVEEERGEAEDLPSEPVEKHTGRRGGPAAPKTELRNSGPQFAQQKESQSI